MPTPGAAVDDQMSAPPRLDGGASRFVHVPTLVAISTAAWALANVLHEIVGHAGSAVLLGIPVKAVSTTTAFIESEHIQSAAEVQIMSAAGVLVNLLTGAVALVVLRFRRSASKPLRCFLWLFATMSFVLVAMNLVTAFLLGGGDWAEVTKLADRPDAWRLEPRALYVAGIVCVGIVVAVVGFAMPLRLWMPAMGDDHRTLRRLFTVVPVVTLVIVQSLSLLRSPFGTWAGEYNHLASSVFAYAHFALWATLVNVLPAPRSADPVESIQLERSLPWLIGGLVVFVLFVVVLGPGLGPLGDDPRLK